jgi:transcriptional regulator with XRE-family HTH domain
MVIGQRLRALREQRGLSQGDIEKESGLLRCYISRVEHGHTIPSLDTLERFAAVLGVPLYQLFYNGEDAPATGHLSPRRSLEELAEETGPSGGEARLLLKLKMLVGKMSDPDRSFLVDFARKLATR